MDKIYNLASEFEKLVKNSALKEDVELYNDEYDDIIELVFDLEEATKSIKRGQVSTATLELMSDKAKTLSTILHDIVDSRARFHAETTGSELIDTEGTTVE